MFRKYALILLVCFMVCFTGCGNSGKETYSQIPEIVFLYTITYAEAPAGEPRSAITFYDKEGNHYVSTDAYVCSLDFEQLSQEFVNGTIADRISYHTSCNLEELLDNYSKLCQLSKNDLKIIHSESGPDVIANYEIWYGLYYDQDGNIQALRLHERDEHGDHYANDSRANEIYEWYIGTFK